MIRLTILFLLLLASPASAFDCTDSALGCRKCEVVGTC